MTTMLEETVQPVQAETLFEATQYRVNKAGVKFGGLVYVDLTDERDIDLFRNLTPGVDHELRIVVRVAAYQTKFGEDDTGSVDDVGGQKTLIVQSVKTA